MLRKPNERAPPGTTLGQGVRDEAEARAVVPRTGAADRIRRKGCDECAVKLTHLGLVLDEELAYGNVAEPRARCAAAASSASTWRGRPCRATLASLPRLREALARQRRHGAAVLPLSERGRPAACPAGSEPALVRARTWAAGRLVPKKRDVDAAYAKPVEPRFRAKVTAVATHDEALGARSRSARIRITNDRFSSRCSTGPAARQLDLVPRPRRPRRRPYGPDWYATSAALAERRPTMFLRNLVLTLSSRTAARRRARGRAPEVPRPWCHA